MQKQRRIFPQQIYPVAVFVVFGAIVLFSVLGMVLFPGNPVLKAGPAKLPRVTLRQITTPARNHKRASKKFEELFMDFRKGKKILETAPLAKEKDLYDTRVLKLRNVRTHPSNPGIVFKINVEGPSGEPVSAIFKPFQARYRDGFNELAACKTGEYLGVHQPACGERTLTRNQLSHALKKIPARYQNMLQWEDDKLRGFVRLWAHGFRPAIGRLAPSRDNMLAMARQIRPEGICNNHQICLNMSDVLILDFMISNNDRQYNIGTVLTSENNMLLFPIDFGDGFTGDAEAMKRKIWYRRAFFSLVRFRKTLIESIRRLDRRTVERLTSDSKGSPLVSPFHRDRMLEKRAAVLKRVGELEEKLGDQIFF